MPVPKRRTSKSKKNKRKSHDALTSPQWSTCSNCGASCVPHRVCPGCGHYRGRNVVPVGEG